MHACLALPAWPACLFGRLLTHFAVLSLSAACSRRLVSLPGLKDNIVWLDEHIHKLIEPRDAQLQGGLQAAFLPILQAVETFLKAQPVVRVPLCPPRVVNVQRGSFMATCCSAALLHPMLWGATCSWLG